MSFNLFEPAAAVLVVILIAITGRHIVRRLKIRAAIRRRVSAIAKDSAQ